MHRGERRYPPFTVYAHVEIVFLPRGTARSLPLSTVIWGRETTDATFQEADTSGRTAAKSTENIVDYNTTRTVINNGIHK